MTLYQRIRSDCPAGVTISHQDELIAAEREVSKYLRLRALDMDDDRPIPYEAIERLTARIDPDREAKRHDTEAFIAASGWESDINWLARRQIDAAFRFGMALGARLKD
jgi:hypothetical protein